MLSYDDITSTSAPPADRRDSYGPHPLQFGELRLPPNALAKSAVVVLIHGGCWQSSYDLGHVGHAAAALAREGFIVWVPEYRRLGDHGGGWPGTFEDVANAVDHLRTLAISYPSIDTSRVILAGHSAGGQLALWAASRRAGETPSGSAKSPLPTMGAVSLAGITDLAAYGAAAGGCNASVAPLLGGTPRDVADRYRAVSPIELLPLHVPVHLVHGVNDSIVPVRMAEQYAERARIAGDRVQLTVVPEAGHFDVVAPQSPAWSSVTAAIHGIAQQGVL